MKKKFQYKKEFWEIKKKLFQQMVLVQLDIYVQKKKKKKNPDTGLTPLTKMNSRWITDLIIKYK